MSEEFSYDPPPKKFYGMFSPEGEPRGFYVSDVYRDQPDGSRNAAIPAEAVEITHQQWDAIVGGQPRSRFLNGSVYMVDPPPTPPQEPSYVDLLLFEYENRLRSLEGKPPMSVEDFTAKSRK